MAIIVEQEKRNINWFALAVVLAIVVIFGATLYYLFFTPAPLIERVAPSGNLQAIKTVSNINLNPDKVINHPVYKILRIYGGGENLPAAEPRTNPFAPR